MLQEHPDYSMKKSMAHVKELSTTNDPDQTNTRSEQALLEPTLFDDPHSRQSISNSDDRRLLETP